MMVCVVVQHTSAKDASAKLSSQASTSCSPQSAMPRCAIISANARALVSEHLQKAKQLKK